MNTDTKTTKRATRNTTSQTIIGWFTPPSSDQYFKAILSVSKDKAIPAKLKLDKECVNPTIEDVLLASYKRAILVEDDVYAKASARSVPFFMVDCESAHPSIAETIVYDDGEIAFVLCQLANGTIVVYATAAVVSLVQALWASRTLFSAGGFAVSAAMRFAKQITPSNALPVYGGGELARHTYGPVTAGTLITSVLF